MCALQVLKPENFVTMPWKNGGGITHEIAKRKENDKFLWRLSIAEVSSDGPFSVFAGLQRILTVIEGDGLALQTPDTTIEARPMKPVSFSGDTPVTSTRGSAIVKDFNVIFDPLRIHADVKIVKIPFRLEASGATVRAALLLERGQMDGVAVPAHSLVLIEDCGVSLTCIAPMICVSLLRL